MVPESLLPVVLSFQIPPDAVLVGEDVVDNVDDDVEVPVVEEQLIEDPVALPVEEVGTFYLCQVVTLL